MLFPKKQAEMPKGNWKAWLAFSPKTSTPEKKKPEKPQKESPPPKPKKELKRTPLKPPKKPIAKIGKKRKERILSDWSETDMNRDIWNTRPHWCEQCGEVIEGAKEPFRWTENAKGEKVQKLIRPECFAHKLAKGMYPKHRLNPENIALVCSRDCHHLIDQEYSNLEIRRLLDEELSLIS